MSSSETERLPYELLLEVFELLGPSDIRSSAQVCRGWSWPAHHLLFCNIKVTTHSQVLNLVEIVQNNPSPERAAFLSKTIRTLSTSVGVSSSGGLPTPVQLTQLPNLLEQCPKLYSLKIDFKTSSHYYFEEETIERFSSLPATLCVRKLDVKSWSFRSSIPVRQFIGFFPSIDLLTLRGWMFAPQQESRDLAPSFHIRELVCDTVPATFGHHLIPWALRNSIGTLQSLDISLNSPILARVLEVHGRHLTSLNLRGDIRLADLDTLNRLVGSSLTHCTNITLLYLEWPPLSPVLNALPISLEHLITTHLTSCSNTKELATWVKVNSGKLRTLTCRGVPALQRKDYFFLEETCREASVKLVIQEPH